jgi:hypothetical protein
MKNAKRSKSAGRSNVTHKNTPPPLPEKIWLSHRVCGFGVFLVVLAIYAWTCARTVTMEDSGEFLLSAFKMGIDHPPGYPVFVLLGKLFSFLPFGTVAYRVHLVSSVASAIACVFVYLITFRLTRHQIAAVLAALLLACSKTFWSQSVIAEVYALNSVLFFAIFWIGFKLQDEFRPKLFYLAGFLCGLALANSWPLIILESGAFAILLWPLRQHLLRSLLPFLGCALLGLSAYGFLIFRSYFGGTIFFINPVHNLEELWAYVARSTYDAENVQATWTAFESFKFFKYFVFMLTNEFGWLGGPLVALGLVISWKKLPRLANIAMWMAFLSSSVFLLFAWRAEFNYLTQEVYSVFHLVPFGMAAIWMITGLLWLCERIPHPRREIITWALGGVVLLTSFVLNFAENDLSHDSFGQDFAEISMRRLPRDSVVMVWGDADTGSFAYTSLVAGYRPDVVVTSQMGVIFPERVFDREAQISDYSRAVPINNYVRRKLESGHRVFTTRPLVYPSVTHSFPYFYVNRGTLDEITPTQQQMELDQETVDEAVHFMDKYEAKIYKRQWSYHRNILLRRFCNILAFARIDHPLLHDSPDCKMALVERAAEWDHNPAEAVRLVHEVLHDSPVMPLQDKADVMRILFANRINEVNMGSFNPIEKTQRYQAAIDEVFPFAIEYPMCLNSLTIAILQVRAQAKFNVDLTTLGRLYGGCPAQRKLLDDIYHMPN